MLSAAPAALCRLASCGLLWRALRCTLDLSVGTACCSCSLAQSCPKLFSTPWTVAHQAPLSLGCPRSFARNPSRQYSCPLALAWLSAPCREHKVFFQDTEVKNPSLWLEDERTRWEMLQRGRGEYSQKLPRTAVWVLSVGWLAYDNKA